MDAEPDHEPGGAFDEAVHALAETAIGLDEITGPIHAAGVSPSQASPSTILKVDLLTDSLHAYQLAKSAS